MRGIPKLLRVREEIDALRDLIDAVLDSRVAADDPLLRACAATLRERRYQLEVLEIEHGLTA